MIHQKILLSQSSQWESLVNLSELYNVPSLKEDYHDVSLSLVGQEMGRIQGVASVDSNVNHMGNLDLLSLKDLVKNRKRLH